MTDQIGAMPPARLRHPEMHLGAGLGLSAGGRPKALLDFDFTTISALDSRISFTRASPATRINANGHVETVAAHQPRFSHDPVTLRSRGLLVEDQRTNVLLHSENFDAASWAKTRCSIASTSALTPGGSATAARIVEDGTTGVHGLSQTVTLNAGAHTRSVYLKPAGRSWAKLACGSLAIAYCDLSTGVMGSVSGTGAPTATIEAAGNGWLRVSLSFTATAGAAAISLSCATSDGGDAYVGDGTSGLHLWGEQLEAGGFASSYIPTAGVAVTRMMDLPVVLPTIATALLSKGSGYIKIISEFPRMANGEIICIDDGLGDNSIEIYRSSSTTLNFFAKANSSVVADVSSLPKAADPIDISITYDIDDYIVQFASMGIRSGSMSGTQFLNTIRFGQYRSPGFSINAHIVKFVYT
ncbi:hypothetical protein [Rhizorhabdus sp.]|uniref:phage head spike fiber domain-containing protein n=1 Tax=Rhizorhabdus sp. TaxID=1968843 RepID=UPI0035B4CC28